MINFMQSSYFGSEKLSKSKITVSRPVSSHEWSELTGLLPSIANKDAAKYITKISLSHNLHKKQILLGYMNHILRKLPHMISNELIAVFENVAHSSDDMPCDDLVNYFVSNIFKSCS